MNGEIIMIRIATINDIDSLVELRIKLLKEQGTIKFK
jgi:hypothetical protein